MLQYVHVFPVTYDFEKQFPDIVPCSKWTMIQTTAIKHMKVTEGGNLSLTCILSTSKNPRCTQPLQSWCVLCSNCVAVVRREKKVSAWLSAESKGPDTRHFHFLSLLEVREKLQVCVSGLYVQ